MPKPLPPSTIEALTPPPTVFPYTFFVNVERHPLVAQDRRFNLRNAWLLADAAFLAYSDDAEIGRVLQAAFPDVSVTFFSIRRSTQAYVAASLRWIVVAVRGTEVGEFWDGIRDWAVNLQVIPVREGAGGLVHAGFVLAVDEIWPTLREHIRQLQRSARRPVWITGHSLGAAVGMIAAARARHEPELGVAGVYAYGAPRVGDGAFASGIELSTFRVRHNQDVVAHVPFGPLFRHAGRAHYIDASGRLDVRMNGLLEMLLDAKLAALRLVTDLRRPASLLQLPRLLADHAPISYAVLLWNAYERTIR